MMRSNRDEKLEFQKHRESRSKHSKSRSNDSKSTVKAGQSRMRINIGMNMADKASWGTHHLQQPPLH
eukprot:1156619-Pelagomonas_calceolata.AAC.2